MKQKNSTECNRRSFIAKSATAAGFLAFPTIVPSSVFGKNAPSNRVNVASIGVGARSKVVNEAGVASIANARIIACADPNRNNRDRFVKVINEKYGGDYCQPYSDFREVLKRDDIDAVTICTTDHWHVPLATAAARAGKDMYVEKPVGVSMTQAIRLRKEIESRRLVFQYGTQQRSTRHFRQACELARNGYIGDIKSIDVWCDNMYTQAHVRNEKPYGETLEAPVPDYLDYDMWIGPAPLKPYSVDRCKNTSGFHVYDYSLGFIAGWGAHPLDIAQWGLGMDHTSPVYYEGSGTLPPSQSLYDTIHSWDVHCHYANGVSLRFFSKDYAEPIVSKYHYAVKSLGTVFHGTQGWIGVDREAMYSHDRNKLRSVNVKKDEELYRSEGQQQNFIDCVRSRKPTISPFESAIRSDTISHMSDIAIRTAAPVEWNPSEEKLVNGSETATTMLDRPIRKKWRASA